MKKIYSFLVMGCLLLLVACGSSSDKSAFQTRLEKQIASQKKSDIVEIKDKMFLTQLDDIFMNFSDYEGKVIKVEGVYMLGKSFDHKTDVPVVFRIGPGCCGNDGWGGFLLEYDGEYPETLKWVEVIGTPEIRVINGIRYLSLNVTSITSFDTYGAYSVEQ